MSPGWHGALPDILWLRPDPAAMAPSDRDSGFGRGIGVFLNGGDGVGGNEFAAGAVVAVAAHSVLLMRARPALDPAHTRVMARWGHDLSRRGKPL